jgi:hypothetical protein
MNLCFGTLFVLPFTLDHLRALVVIFLEEMPQPTTLFWAYVWSSKAFDYLL